MRLLVTALPGDCSQPAMPIACALGFAARDRILSRHTRCQRAPDRTLPPHATYLPGWLSPYPGFPGQDAPNFLKRRLARRLQPSGTTCGTGESNSDILLGKQVGCLYISTTYSSNLHIGHLSPLSLSISLAPHAHVLPLGVRASRARSFSRSL